MLSVHYPSQNRIKQMMETAQKQRDEVAAEFDKVRCCPPFLHLNCVSLPDDNLSILL
jgi:hypothetical protein